MSSQSIASSQRPLLLFASCCLPGASHGLGFSVIVGGVFAQADNIERDGFAFVRAPEMWRLLEEAGLADWEGFAASWGDLGVDAYMADGGRYRRRRFGIFRAAPAGIVRKPHQPHYQSRDYNALNGGVERWFEPVTEAAARHPATTAILRTCHSLFDRLTPAERVRRGGR